MSPENISADQIIAVIPDLIFEFSADGRYIALHRGSDKDLYCPRANFLGRHYSEVLPAPVSAEFGAAFEKSVSTGEPTTVSYLLPDGEENRYYECRFLPTANDRILALIRNAGEILLGEDTPFSAANYAAGPNAVLPTGGAARTYSAVSVRDFMKHSSVIHVTPAGYRELKQHVIALAEYEGFFSHAEAFKRRDETL